MFRIFIAATAAVLATSASASIQPIVVDGVPTARVSYADLNLHSAAGQAHMAHRIRSAAERLCVRSFNETGFTEPPRNDCYVAAVASGMTQLADIAGR